MHVPVAQSGDKITAIRLDDFRRGADAVARIRPAIGEAARRYRQAGAGNDLARMNIDLAAVPDDEIGRGATHRNVNKVRSGFTPGFEGHAPVPMPNLRRL